METTSGYLLTFLLNASWQVAAIAIITLAAAQLLKDGPARYRHAMWVFALLAAICLPVLSTRSHAEDSNLLRSAQPMVPHTLTSAPIMRTAQPSAIPAAPTQPIRFSIQFATIVIALYFAFVLFRLCTFALALGKTRRIVRSAKPAAMTEVLERVWLECLSSFGLSRVELLTSPNVAGPVTVGAFRPAVIIPESFVHENSEALLTTAIGHELAHVARRDFALNTAYELFSIPLSFHPACWLMRQHIERTREMACDEAVTTRLLEPPVYARSLVAIAQTVATVGSQGFTLGVFDGNILETRIRRMLSKSNLSVKRARMLLVTGVSALALCAVVASTIAFTARAQTGFQTEMKAAEDAYNTGDFGTAVDHFQRAVAMEPGNNDARLFLAHALMSAFYNQREAPDTRLIASATEEYAKVLSHDPTNQQALAGMTTLAIDSKDFDAAHEWALKLEAVAPNDKTVYYTIGVVDWSMAYPQFQRARQASGSPQEFYLISDATLRKNFRDSFGDRVSEGIQAEKKAIQIDPQYYEAMAYLNLLYRLNAAMTDNQADAKQLIAEADAMVGTALQARKNAPPPAKSTSLDVNGPAPGPAGRQTLIAAPPPPPPPPPPPGSNQPASAIPAPSSQMRAPAPGLFWQVTGEPGVTAMQLLKELQAKGFDAVVNTASDNQTRVAIGPYFDEESALKAREAAQTAGFHVVTKVQ